ncbi:MAG: D-2-hydroxyacid dehydrogenase [Sphaerochaetaceae bacterium]|jgi:glycerate dehydrogenase|nr:D-2-hydroxyacid dehydrogenase [Sphaerochaetaceae bacterium]
MHKIIVLDHPRENPGELDWSCLNTLGEFIMHDQTSTEEMAERIGDADIVMLNKSVLTAGIMSQCPNLKFVSVIASGYNTVDLKAASELGIKVANVPNYGTGAISQHAIALLLALTNRVTHHDTEVRKGRKNSNSDWCFWDYPIIELEHKNAGIIGLGRIGYATAKILAAFGMNILAYDTTHTANWENEHCRYVDLDTLYSDSDVIFLHCPVYPENTHMICKSSIEKMRDGVIIINNSRGALIVDEDLAEALESGKVGAAGLDTVEHEPIALDNPLLSAKNCIITPHISWAALDCRKRLQKTAIDNVKAFIEGSPINLVN